MKTRTRRGLYAPELLEARIAPATFIVTSLLDPTDAGNMTLRDAIGQANGNPGADTIVFKLPNPTVPGTITLDPILGGEIPITGPLTIKGPGIDLLTISGSDMIRIFNIDDGNIDPAVLSPTTISGLTLTDGFSATAGGAICSAEPLTLKNVVVRSSYASSYGGGIFVRTDGKISITGSRIVHNEALNNAGGLYLAGKAGVSVVKSTIADNTAKFFGGLYASAANSKAIVLIDTSIIANNTATIGVGGGLGVDTADDGRIILKKSLITGNAAATHAGGVYFDDGNLTVTNTTFSNNTATKGGALSDNVAKSLTISGSRFLGNRATDPAGPGGGALYLQGPTLVKITGSLFSQNSSANTAGAISSEAGVVTLAIAGSSFLGNTADGIGGALSLQAGAVLTMKNSILSGNSAELAGGAIIGDLSATLNLTGNKFTENRSGTGGGAIFIGGNLINAATANLSGNLFQANVSDAGGGAIFAIEDSILTSKGDKFIGNVARTGAGGAAYLDNAGASTITSSLFQGNVAGGSGGGLRIEGFYVVTGVKVLDNITGPEGLGGGIRIGGGVTQIAKSIVTGNVAADGGGVLYNAGSLGIDDATRAKIKGNSSGTDRKNLDQF